MLTIEQQLIIMGWKPSPLKLFSSAVKCGDDCTHPSQDYEINHLTLAQHTLSTGKACKMLTPMEVVDAFFTISTVEQINRWVKSATVEDEDGLFFLGALNETTIFKKAQLFTYRNHIRNILRTNLPLVEETLTEHLKTKMRDSKPEVYLVYEDNILEDYELSEDDNSESIFTLLGARYQLVAPDTIRVPENVANSFKEVFPASPSFHELALESDTEGVLEIFRELRESLSFADALSAARAV